MSEPTVGRMVFYQAFGTPGGEYPSVSRAAVITEVQTDGKVGLCVMNPTGLFFNRNIEYADPPKAGCWSLASEGLICVGAGHSAKWRGEVDGETSTNLALAKLDNPATDFLRRKLYWLSSGLQIRRLGVQVPHGVLSSHAEIYDVVAHRQPT